MRPDRCSIPQRHGKRSESIGRKRGATLVVKASQKARRGGKRRDQHGFSTPVNICPARIGDDAVGIGGQESCL
jgi:hypothetical protein